MECKNNTKKQTMKAVFKFCLLTMILIFGGVHQIKAQGFLKGLMDVDVIKHDGGLEEQVRYLPFKGKTGRIHFYYFAAEKDAAEKYIEKNKLTRVYSVDREYARQTASTARAELTKALKSVLTADQIARFNDLRNNPFEANMYVYNKEHKCFPMFIVFEGAGKCINEDQIRKVLGQLSKVKLPVLPTTGLKTPDAYYVFEPAIHKIL
ncbi:hypothetical protein [Prevotella sp. KH2C16]|uniref:hypothetical protein n=1 Tax=Prevotella sp. KH2C16 TaxID=1855325 RepID=UPI0015A55C2D|nr:hypothetical protein [Prevotella sp. KH2C16]